MGELASELKRKGVTLTLLWQEYRERHPNGYGYTWLSDRGSRVNRERICAMSSEGQLRAGFGNGIALLTWS